MTIFWSLCVIWFALAITALKSAQTKLFKIKESIKGISYGDTVEQLLRERKLTLDKAMSVYRAHESAKPWPPKQQGLTHGL